jgi:ribokinase
MPEAAARIVVIGSFVQACCWRLQHLPGPGETALAPAFSTEPAGKGLAVAVGCKRLGIPVDLLLAIGTDAAGDGLLAFLTACGISADHVHRKTTHSGHGAGLIDAAGENMIAVYPGANQELGNHEVRLATDALSRASLVYGQLEAPPAAVAAAFAVARSHGVRTVLNPSPWRELPPALLAYTDILIVNVVEAGLLFERSLPPARKDRLAAISAGMASLSSRWNGELLVVTMGEQGSAAFAPDGTVVEAPATGVLATNTLGAGDAFSAGWCVALATGEPVRRALALANNCGAYAVTTPGILDGLPFRADLNRLFRPVI